MSPSSSKESITEDQRQKIHNDLNALSDMKHNSGQPKKLPVTKAGEPVAKFLTKCAKEHGESLKCIEQNYQNRSACTPYFEAYKACRKEENELRKQANAAASAGGKGGWFW